jgi:sec-independent protein translocase protein TatC
MPLDQEEAEEQAQFPHERNMSFFDHVDELRRHIIRSFAFISVGFILAFIYIKEIVGGVIFAPFKGQFITYRMLCNMGKDLFGDERMCITPPVIQIQNLQLQGQFVAAFKIAFIAGLILAFPFIIWELWKFIRPALSDKEVRKTRGTVFFVGMLFFTGVLFSYFILVPISVNFFANFSISEEVQNIVTMQNAVNYVSFLCLATGLVFELPVLMYILARVGIVTASFLRKNRRYAVVIIFIIAAVATPSPDMLSQLILALPLYSLYEVGILIAARSEKKEEQAS